MTLALALTTSRAGADTPRSEIVTLTTDPNPNQVLTHLKEKLQFVQAENQVLKHDLADLEIELTNKRDVRTPTQHEHSAWAPHRAT